MPSTREISSSWSVNVNVPPISNWWTRKSSGRYQILSISRKIMIRFDDEVPISLRYRRRHLTRPAILRQSIKVVIRTVCWQQQATIITQRPQRNDPRSVQSTKMMYREINLICFSQYFCMKELVDFFCCICSCSWHFFLIVTILVVSFAFLNTSLNWMNQNVVSSFQLSFSEVDRSFSLYLQIRDVRGVPSQENSFEETMGVHRDCFWSECKRLNSQRRENSFSTPWPNQIISLSNNW